MTRPIRCHHGHELSNPVRSVENDEVVCPYCGSLTTFRSQDATKKIPLDATLRTGFELKDPTKPVVVNSDAEDDLSAADPSMFVTLEFQSSNPTEKSGSDVESRLRKAKPTNKKVAGPFSPPKLEGYSILEELGRGGMGVVYRARDERLGRDVALKTLLKIDSDSLHRFKQEFRALADITHPNLVSLYELLSDGETWCFSMEILKGVEFLEFVWSGFKAIRREHQLPTETRRLTHERLDRFRDAMKQLSLGLHALHDAGKLHSDVKPSNMLMTEEGRLVLLDFGLAMEIKNESENRSRIIQGTPYYMSPEQTVGLPMSPASDWYAVGVVLYEFLTGQFPFHGRAAKVMAQKRNEVPRSPMEISKDVPLELGELCMALLDRDPTNRPGASDILRCIGEHELADELISNRRLTLTKTIELVGREHHIEILSRSFDEVSEGNTRSIFVHGNSGMGKSVLVRHFLDSMDSRAVILEGRCYEQESVPFKALDSLIDSLAVYLNTLSEEVVHGLLPRDRNALNRVFPVLAGVPDAPHARFPTIENADQQELRQRAMNALRELLQRLAIREPLVLYIDDLQWGDVDSAELLADLVRPPDAPQMLLLGSYRSENVKTSLCLQTLTEAYETGLHRPHREELIVQTLSEQESKKLALRLLGEHDSKNLDYAATIAKESRGWPFFVWELAQHVQEGFAPDQKLELDEVIWSRVIRLPEPTIRMLELIAVAGRPMPAVEILTAMDSIEKGAGFLGQLRANNFTRTTGSETDATIVETYHDRIRESVLNHLGENRIRELNLDLAEMTIEFSGIKISEIESHINSTPAFAEPSGQFAMSKRQWERVFDLAFFFDAAAKPSRAFPFALIAGEQAKSQNALEVAEQQFQIALKEVANVAPGLGFRVREGLGDTLVLRGRYSEAAKQFNEARNMVSDELVLARMDYKLGVAALKKGDMGEALSSLEKSIRGLGERPPSALSVVPRAMKEAFVQFLHTRFPSRFVGNKDPDSEKGQLDLFRSLVYDQLTFSYWFARGMKFVLWSHLRQMNLTERYPPSSELGKNYAFHAVTMTGIPMAHRGIAYAKKAYEISVEKGDLWGQGRARSFHTFSCIVLAKFKEGVVTGREATQLLEQAGDIWEANMARMIATVPMYHLGDLETAYLESKKAYKIGLETGDYSAICISLLFWIPANPKTIPAGAIQTELERKREDPLTITAAVFARGLELLFCEDDPLEAANVLEASLQKAKKLGIRNVCLFSAATWKVTALRIAAEREKGGDLRRVLLKKAKSASKTALKITRKYLACRPRALRERALIALLENKQNLALKYFDESLKVAESHEAKYEHARSLHARAEAGVKFGWENSADDLERAKQIIESIEAFWHAEDNH